MNLPQFGLFTGVLSVAMAVLLPIWAAFIQGFYGLRDKEPPMWLLIVVLTMCLAATVLMLLSGGTFAYLIYQQLGES